MAKRKPTAEPAETAGAPDPAPDYTVLARRYRPQQFGELVGQDAVSQALANAITSGRVAHAYLFTGARGVGKTSTARILAKCLNCEKGPTPTPCGQCDACLGITTGEYVDVLEIDGASNNGVDDVRDLRGNVQYRPQKSRFKIYIIDEVHMLSKGAFNALLKTLEEPPPHVKFIFATTEASKIPITILSRCQRFDFGGISLPRIVERLKQIVAREGMQADDRALELVARRAGGSMRDAQSLLDQLLSFGGDKLTTEAVNQLLGTAHEERVAALAAAVVARDVKTALATLGDFVNQGQQLTELIDQLIDYWRDLMVVSSAGSDGQDLSVTDALRGALESQARSLKLDTILAGLDVLVAAKTRMRGSSHGRVVLEMALIRLTQLDDLVPLTQLAQWVRDGVSVQNAVQARHTHPGATGPVRTSVPAEKKKLAGPDENSPPEEKRGLTEASLPEVWQQVLRDVGFAIAAELRRAETVAIIGPKTLVLRFPSRYNVPGESTPDPRRFARVEELLAKITGEAWSLRVEFVAEPANGQGAKSAGDAPVSQAKKVREEVRKLPLVQKARDLLDADIVSCDPEFGTPAKSSGAAADESEDE